MHVTPYLNFDGNCAEAMKFYQSVFGGELEVQSFGDAFPDASAATKDRVMHARLQADGIEIMASDTNPEQSETFAVGNNVHLSLHGSDEAELTSRFDQLAEGGSVTMPLEKQFWGAVFGMVTDKYGVHWMVNIDVREGTS